MNIFSKVSTVLLVLIFIPVFLLAQNEEEGVQSVKMVDQFVIGGDVSKPVEYSLSRPMDIATDSQGNVYIADQGKMAIKVFTKTGQHIRTIGKRGRGPGEFLSIRALHVNAEDELIVIDGEGFRIVRFTLQGKVLDTYPMSKENQDILFFNQFTQLPNEKYIVLYKKFGSVGNDDEIFHIWNHEFINKEYSFGSFEKLDIKSVFEEKAAQLRVGSMFFKSNKELLFAPVLYKGTIYAFEKIGDQWSSGKDIQGYGQLPEPGYKIIQTIKHPTPAKLKKNRDVGAPIELYTQDGVFKGDIYATSAGIFTLNDGFTAHFSFIKTRGRGKEDKEKWKLGVELFDENLNYLGYFPLRSFNNLYNPLLPPIKAKDSNDNFYMISQKGYPIVQKFSLDIKTD